MGNTLSIKKDIDESSVTLKKKTSKVQNEDQYDKAGAYSLVAYKNQSANSKSDLDIAKENFENKYKRFLIMYGQYSNTAFEFEYPINENTPIFVKYPNLKPR